MSDDELDPVLGRKLAALHGDPEPPLGDDALARVIAAAQLEGMRLARARRVRRIAFGAGAVLAAAAAAWLVWIAPHHREDIVAVAPATPVECALPFDGASAAFTRSADGRQALSLGVLGQLFAGPSAVLEVERASACELSVRLVRGELAGDLSNLRPAVLRIRTQLGEVVVRGTRFAVAADDGLEVVLLSGAVDVLSPGQATVHLLPGKTLHRRAANAAVQVGAVSPEHARKLDALLSGAPAVAPSVLDAGSARPHVEAKPSKSTADLLSAAEAERRRGRLPQARALYREAGMRSDENAEVALLRWARLELDAHDAPAAQAALKQYQRRFQHGRLATEAAWLEVRALSALGERSQSRAAAEQLIARFPNTPQAKAARQLLDAP